MTPRDAEPPRPPASGEPSRWWGVEHTCAGIDRVYPTLHWADEPEEGAGPRQAFECDACGDRYAFHEAEARQQDGSGLREDAAPMMSETWTVCPHLLVRCTECGAGMTPVLPARLDVERLGQALDHVGINWPVDWDRQDFAWIARQVAARYARLQEQDR